MINAFVNEHLGRDNPELHQAKWNCFRIHLRLVKGEQSWPQQSSGSKAASLKIQFQNYQMASLHCINLKSRWFLYNLLCHHHGNAATSVHLRCEHLIDKTPTSSRIWMSSSFYCIFASVSFHTAPPPLSFPGLFVVTARFFYCSNVMAVILTNW